jgi:hypothetical protein
MTPLRASQILVPPMPMVHQQLLGHMCTPRSRLGSSQCGAEERRVPLGVYSMLLQQEEHHPRGQRQVYHHVLHEGSQGLILDPQAHHEESQDVRRDVGNHQQVRLGQGGDPRHQRAEGGGVGPLRLA